MAAPRQVGDHRIPPYQPLENALEQAWPYETRKIAVRHLHIDPVYIAPPVEVGPHAQAIAGVPPIPSEKPLSTPVYVMQRKDGTYWVYYEAARVQAVHQELGPDWELNCLVYQDPTQ